MTQRTDRLWLMGGIVVIALLAVASWFLVISPRHTDTAAVRDQVGDGNVQLAKLRRQLSELDAKKKQLPAMRAQYAAYQKALPSEDALPANNPQAAFLNQLQDFGTAANVDINSLTVGEPTASEALPSVNEVAITLSVEGNVNDMSAFLLRMQNAQGRAVLISSVGLTAKADADGTNADDVTASLVLTAFETPKTGSTKLTTK
ncbi:type 4a pilus biogenesis protein PilO [Actinoplanes sp. NPDC051343]|jgi:Tfp pilus assembly protein PilO|uniref:type 4a pilus biogenesis protein PilO n=1 Tax=Actinoplanes sp. NPDC051343 TaxID=3363906 RepID=UPI00378DBDB9